MKVFHPNPGKRLCDVHVMENTLAADLLDGRTIIVPLTWYLRLLNATTEQRSRWESPVRDTEIIGRNWTRI